MWFCFFRFCCVLFCVFVVVVASLVVLPVVLEFENGSRDEELLLFSMSQRGDFRMVGVACVVLRAVRLICWMPDCLGPFVVGGVSSSVLHAL